MITASTSECAAHGRSPVRGRPYVRPVALGVVAPMSCAPPPVGSSAANGSAVPPVDAVPLGSTVASGALPPQWGTGHSAVPVTFRTWIADAAPDADGIVPLPHVSVFIPRIAPGVLFGGLAVEGIVTLSVPGLVAALALIMLSTLITPGGARRTAVTTAEAG